MVPEVLAREGSRAGRMKRILAVSAAALCASTVVSVSAVPQNPARQAAREDWSAYLPPGDGQQLVVGRCTGCHDLKGTLQLRKSAAGWEAIVLDMGARGAPLTIEEIDPLVKYLSTAFGPEAPPFTDANTATKEDLTKLPGITAEAADRLIAERTKGPLATEEQLRAALALSPEDFQKVKYYLAVKPSRARRP